MSQMFGDALMSWQRSAIGDGKLCITAGKPQSGVACGKSATINNVPRSGTTLFDVFDADILCRIPSPQVSLRYTSG